MAKKKILLLSDDLRMSSGVGTMSKEFVIGTIHHYDWVQAGGAIKHPEKGKIVDMNKTIREETGVKDANLKIYPIDGYGSQDLIRDLLAREQPDAILHYTDPRFWGFLYDMEHEIRQNIPIFYYRNSLFRNVHYQITTLVKKLIVMRSWPIIPYIIIEYWNLLSYLMFHFI